MGIMIGAIVMNITFMSGASTNIEEKARAMGMVYPDEIRALSAEEGN
jgi:hypothetical protein